MLVFGAFMSVFEVFVSKFEALLSELWKAMDHLSLQHREIILLRHFEDLDYASIAEVLEIPIGTVMSRLFHARKRLAGLMDAYREGRA